MKKKILFILILALLALAIGCSSSDLKNSTAEKNKIPIENISMSVDEGLPGSTANIATQNESTAKTGCDNLCKKNDAIAKKDTTICEGITVGSVKNECFIEIAIAKKSKDVCEMISDLTQRNKCFSLIGYEPPLEAQETTFTKIGSAMCTENGVPIVRMYGASWCSHCRWGFPIFVKVMQEYQERGLIKAYAWEIDVPDDLMTGEKELMMPSEEVDFYYDNDPKKMVPYFNLGCIYDRVGNGHEGNANAEENELRRMIDDLIARLIKQ